ncbi:dihydrolipoyllysine-residue succinyltransferase component of 2-oxoglutarate dehydrogenase complex [Abditibacteriota bacterium]|nr:dihydrolipoyllysine-residue succinyltransferase component of 2-oxoglutarate dehydrogenase complex [Abditibacteriota bacterium]
MQKVVLPRLFENMEEGTIGRWLVSENEQIEIGTPLCELITEKTTLELPSEVAGVVRKLVAPEKAVVPPGFVLALVGEADEPLIDVSAENAALQTAPTLEVSPTTPTATLTPAPTPSASGRLRATPAARRAAKDAGVDLELVAQKFPGKVLSEEDVKQFAEESK